MSKLNKQNSDRLVDREQADRCYGALGSGGIRQKRERENSWTRTTVW